MWGSDGVEPPMTEQVVRIEPNPRWIRGVHRGRVVVDSRAARYVWEHHHYPQWYFPIADVAAELRPNGDTFESSLRGTGVRHDLVLEDGTRVLDAAWTHPEAPDEELRGLVRLEWDALDGWFEEDVEVFVHPRSPEVRVDVLHSSRRVTVRVEGEVVAESDRTRILYETGLRPRYYLPKADVRMELLTPTDSVTACPYKGWASYWDVTVGGGTVRDALMGRPAEDLAAISPPRGSSGRPS